MDRAFDDLVPDELRHLSQAHWTPVGIAIRVAALLAPTPSMRILDIGAGVGKVCAVGALSTHATWVGVERQESLAMAAERLARAFGVGERALFLHGDAFALDWSTFDALYFYNPFEPALFPERVDPTLHAIVARNQATLAHDRLAAMPPGARVVTLHGYGAPMPASYELVHQERVGSLGGDLASWVQRDPARACRRTS